MNSLNLRNFLHCLPNISLRLAFLPSCSVPIARGRVASEKEKNYLGVYVEWPKTSAG